MGKETIRNMRSRMYRIETEIKSKRDKELFVLQIVIKHFAPVSVSKYGQTL